MAFDRRGFYYRSFRDGDRIRRVYLGKGPIAQLADLMVEGRRSERRARSLAWQAREAAREPAVACLQVLERLADELSSATLLAAGYHQHDRGAWRRRRMNGNGQTNSKRVDADDNRGDGASEVPGEEGTRCDKPMQADGKSSTEQQFPESELRELTGRAQRGDLTVLPDLKRLLDATPALWKYCGDVAREAEALWIDLIAHGVLLLRQSLTRKVADMKIELAGPAAPPMERLLVDRVVATWMQVSQADRVIAQLKGKDVTVAQLDLLQRRQERAQRMHLTAIKMLATVRRLSVAVSPAATAKAKGAGEAIPAAGSDKPARSKRKSSRNGGSGGTESVVPKSLRDRMRSLVEADN